MHVGCMAAHHTAGFDSFGEARESAGVTQDFRHLEASDTTWQDAMLCSRRSIISIEAVNIVVSVVFHEDTLP